MIAIREQTAEARFQSRPYFPGITLTQGQIDEYLEKLNESGCSTSTLQSYRRNLNRLYQFLPKDKRIQVGTLTGWRDALLESGCSPKMVNVCVSAANGLMVALGHMELQTGRVREENCVQPELTRVEYLRLLSAARMLGKERLYLLVKVFGTTGLLVSELENLTVEAVSRGEISLSSGVLRIPGSLRGELLNFAEKERIPAGPVFLSKVGKPQARTVITALMKTLCRDAQVPEEKANPRCLRKLYLATQAGIQENISILAEQAYESLLEKEQETIGWESSPAC